MVQIAEYTEFTMNLDSFMNPSVYKGTSANEILIARLIMLEPGTIETHPEMGIGIVSRYRNMPESELPTLERDIESQISRYLPDIYATEVKCQTKKNKLIIGVKANDDVFAYSYDGSGSSIKTEKLELSAFK